MENNVDSEQFVKPVENRQRTDKFFILVFPLSFLVWLGLGISEHFNGAINPTDIWNFFIWIGPHSLIHGVAAVIVFFALTVVLNLLKENSIVIVVAIFIVCTFFTIITCILLLVSFNFNANWLYLILSVLLIFINVLRYNVTTLISTRKFGAAPLGPMIKEPFRAIANSYRASIISFFVVIYFLLMVFVCTVTLLFTNITSLIEQKVTSEKELMWLFIFAFVLTGMCLFSFIWNFGFMVMGDYFAHYYGNENVSGTTVFRSVARVSRYHLGTIGFLSTPILPSLSALIMLWKNKRQSNKQSDNKLINFISKFSLIMSISEYALIQTSIHGSDALKSTRQMVDLHCNNPPLFLTLNAVLLKILDLGMIITMIVGVFAVYIFAYIFGLQTLVIPSKPILRAIVYLALTFYVVTYLVYSTMTLLVRPAACTFTVYRMIHDQRETRTSNNEIELTNR